jgi:putative hemolysin
VNVYTAALATQLSISFAKTSGIEESLAIGMATGLITFLILVFGEIVPKSFAAKNAEAISLKVAPLYKVMMFLLTPVIIILEVLIKLFTGKNVATRVTDEEIESFIDL